MFRKIFMFLCLAGVVDAGAQTYSTRSKITEKKDDPQIDYKQPGAPMPPFKLYVYHDTAEKRMGEQAGKHSKKKHDEDGFDAKSKVLLTNEDLNFGANFFVMIFNPTCSHCEDETRMLEQNMSLFQKSRVFLMATLAMEPYLPDFAKLMKLTDYPRITLGMDSSGFLNNVFLYQALPQINIYNSDRKLIRIFSGEVSIDTLKRYIE